MESVAVRLLTVVVLPAASARDVFEELTGSQEG
jgi:hypothetical protein